MYLLSVLAMIIDDCMIFDREKSEQLEVDASLTTTTIVDASNYFLARTSVLQ